MTDKEGPNFPSGSSSGAISASFYVDSIKAIAESVGISNLQDEAAKELAEDVTFRLKHVIQDAVKFMDHGKRTKLTALDIDSSLRLKNIEPIYGIQSVDSTPFRFASGGGRELHFLEDREIEMQDLVSTTMPKIPLEPTLRAHWLAIEGSQPAVPENPPPQSKDQQRRDSVDPAHKLSRGYRNKGSGPFTPTVGKPIKFKTHEQVYIKQMATHELSVEQQLYYKEIVEACVGSDETRRTEALQSLSNDPGLYEMLPRLCTFILEGVRVNVVQFNLALLIYLMRMVKGLLDNQTLYLEKYLHEILPSVATCIVSKQLCLRPDQDNHWALRDFASRLMAQICKNYSTSTNNIQTRMTRLFNSSLQQEKTPLASVYGAIAALGELGSEVIRVFIVARTKDIGTRLEFCIEGVGHTQADKISSQKIKVLIVKLAGPVIKSIRSPPDVLEEYKNEYGYLGAALHASVTALRIQDQKQITTPNSSSNPSSNSTYKPSKPPGGGSTVPNSANRSNVGQMAPPSLPPSHAVQNSTGQKFVVINQQQSHGMRVVTHTTQTTQPATQGQHLAKVLVVQAPNNVQSINFQNE